MVAILIAAGAVLVFALETKGKLSTGMTGFDSTWYHGPFAAGFFQSGDTWDLHLIAPQFLAWFYPANGEIFHAAGMLAFGRDLLSPLLNLGWFAGCLVACWCIGRPFRVPPWSLALGAIALSVPALADQAGEARNDIVGTFFLLAGVAVMVNAWSGEGGEQPDAGEHSDKRPGPGGQSDKRSGAGGRSNRRLGRRGWPGSELGIGGAGYLGGYLVVGLAAGLAAGTKLNFLLPAAVLVVGLALIAPRGARVHSFAAASIAAVAGGGYWYLRNLVHSGNPLPWIHHLGPIDLPAPEQALGGREAHSVLGYLGDGSIWSDWFLPGLHSGLWLIWPLLLLAALTGLALAIAPALPGRRAAMSGSRGRRADLTTPVSQIGPSAGVLCVVGAVGVSAALAWLVAPTSASGPEGMPRGFESGLRYLAPALVLGLALLPTVPSLRRRLEGQGHPSSGRILKTPSQLARRLSGRRVPPALPATLLLLLVIAVGYPVQRHYLENRYKAPSFAAPGLNAAFAWARDVSGARIATTSTRQYPLFGTDLSNHVEYLGIERPHGGFEAPTNCRQYLQLLNKGDYDYVVATGDRIEPGKPPYPISADWTKAAGAKIVLQKPPTVVFELSDKPAPATC